ncbi:hypothetical protein ABZ863_02020 [Saccharomonospora sp. NPDC046836]|uniref:hypothetical protein n=1 Tax=Saccharomonospora sp. NPDC046836 TaxID=3156921 RepID=UPI0033FD62DD
MSRTTWLVLGLLTLLAFGTWAAWSFTVDDAFITFRYSANLAEGNGPVWNVGDDPVEGFTNFAWMIWHALFVSFGFDPALVAKVTSLVIAVGTLAMLLRATEGAGRIVAGAAYVVFLPTYFHLAGGLETVAFAAAVLRMAAIGVRVIEGRRVFDWEPPLLLLLAGMLRPEGLLAALPGFVVWFWYARDDRLVRLYTGIAAVLGVGYFGWRWIYYGHPLPNTFYVKFGNLTAGWDWTERTLLLFAPLLVLTVLLLVWKDLRATGLLLCSTVVTTCATYALSGPSMDYLHRFAYHVYPVLCLGAGLAVGALTHRWLTAAVGVAAVGGTAVTGAIAPDLPVIANYGADLRRAHVAIGQGLAETGVDPEFETLAVGDAGAIPYYSGWRTIDYIGLNDEAIAHGDDPTDVVRQARPTVVILTSNSAEAPEELYGLRAAEATAGYTHIAAVQMRAGYWQHVFAVPGWAPQIRSALTPAVDQAQRTHDPGRYELTIDRWLDGLRTGR